jgi:DNA-binding NarL/FixJ family response regulator
MQGDKRIRDSIQMERQSAFRPIEKSLQVPLRRGISGEIDKGQGELRFLIVDVCSLGAIGIAEVIKSKWKDAVISHARTGHELKTLLLASTWDMVLMEIDLADQCGIEFMMWAKSVSPGVRILAMSSGEESEQGMRALRAGSAGYFHRGAAQEDFFRAVEQVLGGRRYISRKLADTLARNIDTPPLPDSAESNQVLTSREAQVMQAIACGQSVKQIANALGISAKTVGTCRRRILKKMQFRNDADIVKFRWSKNGKIALYQ